MRVGVNGRKLKARRAGATRYACAVASACLPFAFCLLPFAFGQLLPARAQEVVDRMVAVINGRELITYSDLLWQLALQPDVPLENPRRRTCAARSSYWLKYRSPSSANICAGANRRPTSSMR